MDQGFLGLRVHPGDGVKAIRPERLITRACRAGESGWF